MQVSRAAAQLDAVLQEWRERPWGEFAISILTPVTRRCERPVKYGMQRFWWPPGSILRGNAWVLGVSVSLSEHETHESFPARPQGSRHAWRQAGDKRRSQWFGQPEELFWVAFRGSVASSTCSKMLELMSPNRRCAWRWRQISEPCSMPRPQNRRGCSCKLPSRNTPSQLPGCRPGWKKTWQKGLQSLTFRWNIAASSVPPTLWSGSTRRSQTHQGGGCLSE